MIDGLDKLMKRIEKYENLSLAHPVGKAISVVRSAAKKNCPADHGELRESIFIGAQVREGGSLATGICYTNKSYAPHVEFGTGPKGQEHHEGVSPNTTGAYVQQGWWIPEGEGKKEISKETADMYHMPSYTYHLDGYLEYEKTFRYTEGQPAQPFMYPALKDHEEEVVQIIRDDLRRQLK